MDLTGPSWFLAVAPLILAACGPSAPPPAPPKPAPVVTAVPAAAPEEKPAAEMPASCETKTDKWCLPPAEFAKRLCGGSFPNVALAMFAKGTPWTRAYLRVKSVEAWNAAGGRASSEKIVFEEELLVVAHRAGPAGGMTVNGAGGSVDVLRWDGSCASLMEDEVGARAPLEPKHAKVPWKNLDDAIQNAILADEKVQKAFDDRKRECKGSTLDDGSPGCEKADAKLNDRVVDYVRRGGAIPKPARMP